MKQFASRTIKARYISRQNEFPELRMPSGAILRLNANQSQRTINQHLFVLKNVNDLKG